MVKMRPNYQIMWVSTIKILIWKTISEIRIVSICQRLLFGMEHIFAKLFINGLYSNMGCLFSNYAGTHIIG